MNSVRFIARHLGHGVDGASDKLSLAGTAFSELSLSIHWPVTRLGNLYTHLHLKQPLSHGLTGAHAIPATGYVFIVLCFNFVF